MKVVQPSAFKKDIKRLKKRGKDLAKLKAVIGLLVDDKTLPARYGDHSLSGNWAGWKDCHIEPDWILIYKVRPNELLLGRTGTHSDLF